MTDLTIGREGIELSTMGSGAILSGAGEPAVIQASNLGKRFRIYRSPWARLTEWVSWGKAVRHDDFWALRDVNLEVKRGECVGVIGPNGSGKSTFLKLLTGVLTPTQGTVKIQGRVLSLLELGTGLNPELTGRQNIIHSAQLLAFPPGYAEAKMERIETFAELGEFFDRPIRVYSSGMLVRLSFSMYACFEPDVMIVDEALSVGDVFFQQKCVKRIEEMLAGGVTMLFVSHDMQTVQRLCQYGLLLGRGEVVYAGSPAECASRYYAGLARQRRAGSGELTTAGGVKRSVETDLRKQILTKDILPLARSRHGERHMEVLSASFENEQGENLMAVRVFETVTIRMLLCARQAILSPSAGLHLYDRVGNLVFAAGTRQLRKVFAPMQAGEERVVTMRLKMSVQPGLYTLDLGCSEAAEGANMGVIQDRHEGLGPIEVGYEAEMTLPFYGAAQLPLEIEIEQ